MSARFLAASVALLLAGCTTLEPRYDRVVAPVPVGWPVGDAYLRSTEAALPILDHREIFQDERLRTLIAQALVNNRDLRIAAANVVAARALYRIERSALVPDVGATGDVSVARDGRSGGDARGTGGGGTSTPFAVGVGVSAFELDLFGRIRSLSNAALAEYFGTEAAARTARLTLVAEVASAYLAYATDSSLLRIARATEASAARSVSLTRARLQGGISPRTELRQAETILLLARADIENLTTLLAQDVNALQLVVGAPIQPGLLPGPIEDVGALVGEVPAGLNSAILLRRPDVVQAEFSLRAANARIGAARAAFFPRISLTAIAGLASGGLTSLFGGDAFNFVAGPSIGLPIFDGGARRGNLAFSRAQRDLTVAQYERTIQVAFREVADGLARRGTIGREIAVREERVAVAQDNYELADQAYRGGIGTFLASLDAQRILYEAQQELVTARSTRADNLVLLYRVLGGDQTVAGDPAAGVRFTSPNG